MKNYLTITSITKDYDITTEINEFECSFRSFEELREYIEEMKNDLQTSREEIDKDELPIWDGIIADFEKLANSNFIDILNFLKEKPEELEGKCNFVNYNGYIYLNGEKTAISELTEESKKYIEVVSEFNKKSSDHKTNYLNQEDSIDRAIIVSELIKKIM